ncbi:hypothetical protein EV217_5066 [Phyllobacterium myrsinacearum]|uniref:hypothetical protein n=1 Tax=Phyllobacterium myrsinacearum TaxID=28101 RepID=UPI0010290AF8|nr:hypothetical protein [Phyllobacterium myrsinacearum]RZS76835.1 hypothetical protein EV217_5066 [Phyllobacterium myrsinacearum]
MPVLTVIVGSDHIPCDPQRIAQFLGHLAVLCETVLAADEDKIQVQILAAAKSKIAGVGT